MSGKKKRTTTLSLILPVYNNLKRLKNNFGKIYSYLKRLDVPFEIIIAEDGSTDGTYGCASGFSKSFGNVVHLHSEKKLGRGEALKRAIRSARGGIIGYMDIDLSTDLHHIRQAVEKIEKEGCDVVVGSRLTEGSKVLRSLKREAASRAFNYLVRQFLGSAVLDHQCGFKFFSREFAMKYADRARDSHWFWDTEVLLLAQKEGRKICEIPVKWREGSESTVTLWRDISYMSGNIVKAKLRRL